MKALRPSFGLQTRLMLTFLLLVCLIVAAFLLLVLNALQSEEQQIFEACGVYRRAPCRGYPQYQRVGHPLF